MSLLAEEESKEKIVLVPLQYVKPLPFNVTVIGRKEEDMIRKEMLQADGLYKIDPILLRRMTPEEVEKVKDKHPSAKYGVIDGHTRLRIADELRWPKIRAIIMDVTREQALEMNYRKNKEGGRWTNPWRPYT
jgi:hypothetical protein